MAKNKGQLGAITVRVRATTDELKKDLNAAKGEVSRFSNAIGKMKLAAFGGATAAIGLLINSYRKLNAEILATDENQRKMWEDSTSALREYLKLFDHYQRELVKAAQNRAGKFMQEHGFGVARSPNLSLREQQANDMAAGRITPRQFRELRQQARKASLEKNYGAWSNVGGGMASMFGSRLGAFGTNMQQAAGGIRNRLAIAAGGGLGGALNQPMGEFQRQAFSSPTQLLSGAAAGTQARDQIVAQRKAMAEVERMRQAHEDKQDKLEKEHNDKMEAWAEKQAENTGKVEEAIRNGFKKLQSTNIW